MVRKIYGRIRRFLPPACRGLLTRLLFTLGINPRVKKDCLPTGEKFPGQEDGGLIFSVDLELAWAYRYSRAPVDPLRLAAQSRETMPRLLQLFDSLNIPATWATVGHLLLESCHRQSHDWMKRLTYFQNRNWTFSSGDWFDCDPHTSWRQDPAWYAPDLVDPIIRSRTGHEIGCHTFSHIDFSDSICPPAVAEDEIKACRDAAAAKGITLHSMVFPGGTWGNVPVLKNNGFTIYRKNTGYDLAYPYPDTWGLLVCPSSSGLDINEYGWTPQYFHQRLLRYILQAIQSHTVCHFWLHPTLSPWFLETVLPGLLADAARLRDDKKLWIGTMGAIANHILDNRLYGS